MKCDFLIPAIIRLSTKNIICFIDNYNKQLYSSDGIVINEKDLNYKSVTNNINSEKIPDIPKVPVIHISTEHMEKELHDTKAFFDKEKEGNN